MSGTKTEKTHVITIYIGGDLDVARGVVRKFCYENGACFTVMPTEFIYTGGEECGVAIGLVNYPRFPRSPARLLARASSLAKLLLPALNQRSCLIVSNKETYWLTVDPPGTGAREDAQEPPFHDQHIPAGWER